MGDDGRARRDALRAGWRAAGWYPDLTVGEAIAAGAAAHGEDPIVFAPVDGRATTVSLAALHAAGRRLAGRLHAAGVDPGQPVVLQAPASVASTEVLVALWTLGVTVVPLVATATPGEVAHVVGETGARTAIAVARWRDGDLAGTLAARAGELGLEQVLVLDGSAPAGAAALDDLPDAALPDLPRADPADVACVLYTSGSTAFPKGVQHSHETLLFGVTVPSAAPPPRSLVTFPAGHVASVLGLLRPLAVGGTTVVMDRWSARAAVALVAEHRLTSSAGTPFFLATLLDEAERTGTDISSLTRFLCGAAPVPPALVERAERAGIVTWRTYGSTEHPAIASGGPDDPSEKRHHTDGRVTPGNEVRLVDADGLDVAPGAEGEVVARGPKQFLGYRDASLDAGAFLDGTWFRTGDLARLDDDGYLVITDRAKDIIIRGGENISAREVEEVLATAPAVADVAVCAAPDPVWGEVVCAVVECHGPAPSVEALRAHAAAAGLADHKAPVRVVVVDELPRTPAGKVRKRDLRPLLG